MVSKQPAEALGGLSGRQKANPFSNAAEDSTHAAMKRSVRPDKRSSKNGSDGSVAFCAAADLQDHLVETMTTVSRHLVDNASDLVYLVSTQGKFLYANQALLDLLERDSQQVIGARRSELMPLLDAVSHEEADQQVMAAGHAIDLREMIQDKTGRVRVYNTRKFPLLDDKGQLVGIAGLSRDVTNGQRTLSQQQISELIYVNNPDPLVVVDCALQFVLINPAFERAFGYRHGDLVGKPFTALLKEQSQSLMHAELAQNMPSKGNWTSEVCVCSKDGQTSQVQLRMYPLVDSDNSLAGYVARFHSLADGSGASIGNDPLTAHDTLTGLPNRAVLFDRLTQLILYAERQKQRFSLLYIDLDRFKEVNDTLGHHAGDELLQTLGKRMVQTVRRQDTVARLGGDEFVMLLPETPSRSALTVAEKLIRAIQQPVSTEHVHNYRPELSIGIATYPHDGTRADVLLRNADTAMYSAKASEGSKVMVYSQRMSREMDQTSDIQQSLPQAIERGQLKIYLQPKFDTASMQITGAEALVRWERPGMGLLMPSDFLKSAEKLGLLGMVDRWMMEQSAALLHRWHAMGYLVENWRLSVNQSTGDIKQDGWTGRLADLIKTHDFPGLMLEIELTEESLVQPSLQLQENLKSLANLGVSLCIDDFGTSYSSMSFLQSIPPCIVKIDQTFIKDMIDNKDDFNLIEAMITLTRKFGHIAFAEGVETEQQRNALRELGCRFAQGYLVSPPLPVEEFEARFLADRRTHSHRGACQPHAGSRQT